MKRLRLPPNIQIAVVLLSYAGCATYGLIAASIGSIYPDLLLAFDLTSTQGSIIYALASVLGVLANLTASMWFPRFGPSRAVKISYWLTALGVWMIAGAWSFSVVLAGSVILGFAMGMSGLLTNILAANATDDAGLRRRILSGLHACFGVASFVAPLMISVFARAGFDWRLSFAVIGFAPLIVAVMFWKTKGRGTPQDWKDAYVEQKPWSRAAWYALVCTLYVAVETLLETRLTQYGRDVLGQSVEQANGLLSGFFLTFFIGRVLFTLIPFKHSNRMILLTSILISTASLIIGLYVTPWGFVLTGAGFSIFYPCMMAMLADELGAATAFAMTLCQLMQAIGTIVMHLLVGVLTDKIGLPRTLLFGPIVLVGLLALFSFGFPRNGINRSS